MPVVLPRNAQRWLPGYARARWRRERLDPNLATHVLFCVADHFEPDHAGASPERQRQRVERWVREYPRLASEFRDADGRPPQHTFFFPAEAYQADHLDGLADLCAQGLGEVEVHLHHGHDTREGLRGTLEKFTTTLVDRHGLLSRYANGRIAYGFIHGNWALDNGALDDSICGVNDELTVLRESGCYADFTMPAVPSPAQSRIVNSIYYAVGEPGVARSYDRGVAAQVGASPPPDGLMLIEGPLSLWWARRSGWPRIDSGTLDSSPGNRPTGERFLRWLNAGVCVVGRSDWVFVKVHTHGAPDKNADVLLGDPMRAFHRAIGAACAGDSPYRLHYVTAREMYNIAKAAEAGHQGDPGQFRNFLVHPVMPVQPLTGSASA